MYESTVEAIIHVLYLFAIVVEAMTAAIAAGRRQMDWLGVCVLDSVTARGCRKRHSGSRP